MASSEKERELFDLVRTTLFTAVVGDVLDRMGHTAQFLPVEIGPLQREMVLVGRAMTVALENNPDAGERDYGLLFEALDDLKPGEVFVAGGEIGDYAVWGELMTTRAKLLGALGAVIDGPVRDTRRLLRLGFPVFCRGSYGQDQAGRGKVVSFRRPLRLGQVQVEDGDLLLGDMDGVLAVPRKLEREVLQQAAEKVGAENDLLKDLQRGVTASEAFKKYGIF